MSLGLVGRKVGMMRIFKDDGTSVPVTVLDCGGNRVAQGFDLVLVQLDRRFRLQLRAFSLEAKGKRDPETMGACERNGERKDAAELIACLGPDRRVEIEVVALQKSAASAGGRPAK